METSFPLGDLILNGALKLVFYFEKIKALQVTSCPAEIEKVGPFFLGEVVACLPLLSGGDTWWGGSWVVTAVTEEGLHQHMMLLFFAYKEKKKVAYFIPHGIF